MISALVTLKSLIKNKSYHIDYPIFRLHYQATVCVLFSFCLILTAKILFGDSIDCRGTSGSDDYIDTHCYSIGTYTRYIVPNDCVTSNDTSNLEENFRLLHRMARSKIPCGKQSAKYTYSGIPIPETLYHVKPVVFWHRYYRYIPILLFLQAVFFYLPHYLWKMSENGMISSICKALHEHRFAPEEFIESHYHIVDYIQSCFSLNKSLVYKYYLCHILLMVNLIAQILALSAIFNNQFITYGIDVIYYILYDKHIYGLKGSDLIMDGMLEHKENDINHPMDFVFPKLTGCNPEFIGTAGRDTQQPSYICVLPLNILNDKFFLILWFWFLILSVLTTVQLISDMVYILLPPVRKYLFERKFGAYLSDYNRRSTSLAELFMLDLIGTNSDKFAFSALLKKLNKEEWQLSSPSESESLV